MRNRGPVGRKLQYLRKNIRHRLAVEGLVTRERLVETTAKSPDVRPPVDGFSAGLLRAHIGSGTHDGADRGTAGERGGLRRLCRKVLFDGEHFRQAKVENLDRAVRGAERELRSLCALESRGSELIHGTHIELRGAPNARPSCVDDVLAIRRDGERAPSL